MKKISKVNIEGILHNLVNKKVNIKDGTRMSCCILDLVLWHQHDIYVELRSGFTSDEVLKIEFSKVHLPLIHLNPKRQQYTVKL